jgi:hypothetical protein
VWSQWRAHTVLKGSVLQQVSQGGSPKALP